MKLIVGLPFASPGFPDRIIEYRSQIREVYFSFGDVPNGRSNQLMKAGYTPWELQGIQIRTLKKLADAGLHFNLLFNANCYGKDSQSRAFFNRVGDTVDYIRIGFGLDSVTTSSILIAKFIKNNFPDMDVRASVNMEIGTVAGMEYVAPYFDSYYMKRELNRDFGAISALKEWCDRNGKKMYLLANSGCLNHCSAHTFHDNLVAHESEIAEMDNAYEFHGICREFLKDPSHLDCLITHTNFVRPEDLERYEPYFDAVKLATRVNPHPERVLAAYAGRKYIGNLLDLLEPAHCVYPYVLENGDPPRIVKLADAAELS